LSKGLIVAKPTNIWIDREHGFITKYILPHKFEDEFLASKAGQTIGEASGLFYSPKIFEYNRDQSWIKFEFIPGLTALGNFLSSKDVQLFELLKKAGLILGFIHDNLYLEKINPIPKWFDCEGRHVFLHGDFNLSNIQYDHQNNRIVIIDWSLSPRIRETGNWGVCYFDVVWMINSIFTFPPYMKFDYEYRKDLADAFFESYLQSSGNKLDTHKFNRLGKKLYFYNLKSGINEYGLKFVKQILNRSYLPYYLDHLAGSKKKGNA
jgi:tRNA A-37 threonylcarbamoyl transferase component Bud32